MRGLGTFQMSQMKHRDARIHAMCQHLRAALDLWEQIASEPIRERDVPVQTPPAQIVTTPPLELPAVKLTYTLKEAALAVGVGRSTLYKALSDGALSAVKLGNRTLIPAEALRGWLGSLPSR